MQATGVATILGFILQHMQYLVPSGSGGGEGGGGTHIQVMNDVRYCI